MIKLLITDFLIKCLYLNSFSSFIESAEHNDKHNDINLRLPAVL